MSLGKGYTITVISRFHVEQLHGVLVSSDQISQSVICMCTSVNPRDACVTFYVNILILISQEDTKKLKTL